MLDITKCLSIVSDCLDNTWRRLDLQLKLGDELTMVRNLNVRNIVYSLQVGASKIYKYGI